MKFLIYLYILKKNLDKRQKKSQKKIIENELITQNN